MSLNTHDEANIQFLRDAIAQHGNALAAEQAIYRQLEHLPARLAGERLRQLRGSLNAKAGSQARNQEPELEKLRSILYQQLVPTFR